MPTYVHVKIVHGIIFKHVLGIKSRPTMFKFRQMNLGLVILAQVLA